MISLILAMIGARRAQAATVFVLAAVAVAAAVAGPVALATVDQAIARQEVAAASNTERSLSVTSFVNPSDRQASAQFDTVAALLELPGFDVIRSGELEAFGPVSVSARVLDAATSRVVFRDRLCEHVTILSGRCLAGPLEVVVGEDAAHRAGLHAGDITVIQAARYEQGRGLVPDGAPARLTVVGLYRATDPAGAYWSGQHYFPVTTDGTRQEAVFTNLPTFDAIEHSLGLTCVDFLAGPDLLTLDRLAGLEAEVTDAIAAIQDDPGYSVVTDIPALAERVEVSRGLAGQLVPVAFVPLVALSLFVIYLAVGYGVSGRRAELGLVALRGVKPGRRWLLAGGETALLIVVAAPVGVLLGHAVVALVAAVRLGGTAGAGFNLASLPFAVAALLASLVIAQLGQRRPLREPVADLLRGLPPQGKLGWRSFTVELVIVILAVVATVQLRAGGDGLRGIAMLVPGLVVVAVVLVAARAYRPVVGALARGALRRGRLGLGLAAVQLARRPGSQRLLVLVGIATAMLSFIAAGLDVAARARDDRARIVTGAAAVLTIDQADARRLLHVTRTVDPAGAWAMAAMRVEQRDPTVPPVLAVDSARLPTVAAWRPEFGSSAQSVADALAPPPAEPLLFRGTQVSVDLETVRGPDDPLIDLTLVFVPLAGGDTIGAEVSEVAPGRSVRQIGIVGCAAGCRLTGIAMNLVRGDRLQVTVHSVRQVDPPADVVPASALADRGRWRAAEHIQLSTAGSALTIAAQPTPFEATALVISALDAPLPVPVVAAGPDNSTGVIGSVDSFAVVTRVQHELAMLPRLGSTGLLADLEYLERTSLSSPRRAQGEVWLGPAAPADAADQLRRGGLAVSAVTGIEAEAAALARQGPALALQFHAAAALFGVILALGGLELVAAVDRRQRVTDFVALRRQGLPRRYVRQAALWGYLGVVLAAVLIGAVAAMAGWLAAGDQLPIFSDPLELLRPPRWPGGWAVLVPWLITAGVMVVAAWLAAWMLRRGVHRSGKG